MLFTILAVLFLIIAAIILFKFIKHLFLAGVLVLVLLVLFVAGVGLLVYADIQDFSQKGVSKSSLVVLANDDLDQALVAVHFQPTLRGMEHQTFDEEQLRELTRALAVDDYQRMLGDRYKLVIVTPKALQNLSVKELAYGTRTLTKEEGLQLLESDDALDLLSEHLAQERRTDSDAIKASFIAEGITSESIKGDVLALFTVHVFKALSSSATLMKKKQIIVYPETMLFKAMKWFPASWFRAKN